MGKSNDHIEKELEEITTDISLLFQKGKEFIQRVSGNIWTDHNLHDPGITILEQLCFALTDLGYRTSYRIEDILAENQKLPKDQKASLESIKNAFIKPSLIFSSHPSTILDMRKAIIDHFDWVVNVWIEPVLKKDAAEQLSGLYKFKILPTSCFPTNSIGPSASTASSVQGAPNLKEVRTFLDAMRNLGEGIDEVILLEPITFRLKMKLKINANKEIENVVSDVVVRIFEYFFSPVRFHSINEMKELGMKVDEIFQGPRLAKGFILDEDLKDQLVSFNGEDIQQLVTQVEGVDVCFVDELKLQEEQVNDEEFALDEENDRKYFKIISDSLEAFLSRLEVSKEEVIFTNYDKSAVKRLVREKWSKKYRDFKVGELKDQSYYERLVGKSRNIKHYHSIQHHFPLIYQIGKEAIPLENRGTPVTDQRISERRASSLQLKAYLMFFEQHLANYLTKLSELSDIFNIDYQVGQELNIFVQKMESIPEVDLLEVADDNDLRYGLNKDEIEGRSFQLKHDIFDHLLARFGEELDATPWELAMKCHVIGSEKEFQQQLLHQKSTFLNAIGELNYFRNKGTFFEGEEESLKRSGLERMISIKTGVSGNSFCGKFTTGLTSEQEAGDSSFEALRAGMRTLTIQERMLVEQQGYRLNQEDLSRTSIKDEIHQVLVTKVRSCFLVLADLKKIIFDEIVQIEFAELLNLDNYRIAEGESQPQSDGVSIGLRIGFQDEFEFVKLAEYQSLNEALLFIALLRDHYINKNCVAEGFYLIDHIELKDCLENAKFGFEFYDSQGEKAFHTHFQDSLSTTHSERHKLLQDFYDSAKKEANFLLHKSNNGLFDWIHLVKDSSLTIEEPNNVIASYSLNAESESLAKEQLAEIMRSTRELVKFFENPEDIQGELLFSELEKIRLRGIGSSGKKLLQQRKLVFTRHFSIDEKDDVQPASVRNESIIPESFFDQQISIVLPNWPIRFQDNRFRQFFENIVIERCPSHIRNELKWLTFSQMQKIEPLLCERNELRKLRKKLNDESAEKTVRLDNLQHSLKKSKGENEKASRGISKYDVQEVKLTVQQFEQDVAQLQKELDKISIKHKENELSLKRLSRQICQELLDLV